MIESEYMREIARVYAASNVPLAALENITELHKLVKEIRNESNQKASDPAGSALAA